VTSVPVTGGAAAAYCGVVTRDMLWSATLGDAPLLVRLEAAVTCGYRGITVRPEDVERLAGAGLGIGDVMRWARSNGVHTVMIEASSRWYDHVPPAAPFPSDAYTLDDHLAAAAAVGAKHLNLVAPFAAAGQSTTTDGLVEQFAAACDRCATDGVAVHLEFIPNPPVGSLRAAWDIVRQADRPNGGILFDAWHFFRSDPDLDLLAAIPGERIFSVQLSDGTAEPQESPVKDIFANRLLPGDGQFDLAGVLRTLRATGGLQLAGPEVLSTELDALPPREAARLAGEAFDRVLGA
jgi:sugar phosphate isomerase/epimerase